MAKVPERGTLIIAALLLLAIAFAGAWIDAYVSPSEDPRSLLPWFGAAAAAIVVVGIGLAMWSSRRGG